MDFKNCARYAVVGLAKFLSGASVSYYNYEPDTCQRVYFSNHTSHLDGMVIWSSLPKEVRNVTRFVIAKDYWDKGGIRRYLSKDVFNSILIDRKEIKIHQSPIDIMLKEIGETYSVILFPEGQRSEKFDRDGHPVMGEFKSGMYYLAKKRPELEFIPVYLYNLNRILPRGQYLPVPLLSTVTFGPSIYLQKDEPKVDFLRRTKDSILQLEKVINNGHHHEEENPNKEINDFLRFY